MAPLKDAERRDLLEICDDRYERRSLMLTSQMPVAVVLQKQFCWRNRTNRQSCRSTIQLSIRGFPG
jgi:hypothetical protein